MSIWSICSICNKEVCETYCGISRESLIKEIHRLQDKVDKIQLFFNVVKVDMETLERELE